MESIFYIVAYDPLFGTAIDRERPTPNTVKRRTKAGAYQLRRLNVRR